MSERLTILTGDALARLRELASESVQCVVTSPPYWGLRDYGVKGQLGLERSPRAYLRKMVAIFAEVRRVMRKDGTCWVNMGDGYASNAGGYNETGSRGATSCQRISQKTIDARVKNRSRLPASGLKAKDLVGMPWRVAFALQKEGWYLRSDIIWHKPNPMPESVTDRPTKAHEYLFLLSKSERYYYDAEAILEPVSPNTHARLAQNVEAQIGSTRANGGAKTNGNMKAVARKRGGTGVGFGHGYPGEDRNRGRIKDNDSMQSAIYLRVEERNKRTVWTVPTFSFKGAHFATFPPDLIKPCVLAGSRPGDLVLDPFGGSGTTGQVALELGRRALLIELNPEYVELIRQRCDVTPGLGL